MSYEIVQHKTIPVKLNGNQGFSVEPYEFTLTEEGLFRATNDGLKFATLDLAVAHWHSTHVRHPIESSTTSLYYQVHGPQGERYCPFTGKRQPSPASGVLGAAGASGASKGF